MLRTSFDEHQAVVEASVALVLAPLERAVQVTLDALLAGRSVLALGNGGSAAQAQHLAAELVGRFSVDRPGWPAIALSSDPSAVTAIANDFGFERVFARQVEAHARPGDVVVALSTSGRSPNVVEAARTARAQGCSVVALTGKGGGDLGALADVLVEVASEDSARIQEVHELCIHAWVAELELLAGGLSS